MADTDAQAPETVAPQPLEITSVPQPAPVQGNAELESERKAREQAEMERNLLRNKVSEFEKAQAQAEADRLKEKEDYKTLWEQANAQLTEKLTAEEQAAFQAEVAKKESEVTSQYSEEVLDIAKTAGLKLDGVEDDSLEAFKTKLDKISEKVGGTAKNRPENRLPGVQNDEVARAQALERARQGDKTAVQDAVETLSFIKAYNASQQ